MNTNPKKAYLAEDVVEGSSKLTIGGLTPNDVYSSGSLFILHDFPMTLLVEGGYDEDGNLVLNRNPKWEQLPSSYKPRMVPILNPEDDRSVFTSQKDATVDADGKIVVDIDTTFMTEGDYPNMVNLPSKGLKCAPWMKEDLREKATLS